MSLNATVAKTNGYAELFLQGQINPSPDWRVRECNVTLSNILGHLQPLPEKCSFMLAKDPQNMASMYIHMTASASVFS
jgi:hypothetical protein